MNSEVIYRTIMNILDVKNTHMYAVFDTPQLYQTLCDYGVSLLSSEEAKSSYLSLLMNNKELIDDIADKKERSAHDISLFFEELRLFKRKYMLKK